MTEYFINFMLFNDDYYYRTQSVSIVHGFQLGSVELYTCTNMSEANVGVPTHAPTVSVTQAPTLSLDPPRNVRSRSAGDGKLLVEWDASLTAAQKVLASLFFLYRYMTGFSTNFILNT